MRLAIALVVALPILGAACGSTAENGTSATDAGDASAPSTDAAPAFLPDGSRALDDATTTFDAPSPGDDASSIGPVTPSEAGASDDGGALDASTSGTWLVDADHGAPSTTYPAFAPDVPQIVENGGPTLGDPTIITISWDDDPLRPTFELFADTLGASSYWHTAMSEYGVSGAVSNATTHVHMPSPAPATLTDGDLENLIVANAGTSGSDAGSTPWPAPSTSSTIYVFYLSPSTTLMSGGESYCKLASAYHWNLGSQVAGQWVSYAVIPHCPGDTSESLTLDASHEIAEAATDPYPNTQTPGPSLVGFDTNHLGYEIYQKYQDEVADACEFFPWTGFLDPEPSFRYAVVRQWSNASAIAGHDPCVPLLAEPYYDVTTFTEDEDAIRAGTGTTNGFAIALNETRTFPIGFFSDAATTAPWIVKAVFASTFDDIDGNPIDNGALRIAIDQTRGLNGEKAYVTVTVDRVGASGIEYFVLTSTLAGAQATHDFPILVGLIGAK